MIVKNLRGGTSARFLSSAVALAASAAAIAWPGAASAYFGDSFLSIPGSKGHWRGSDHKEWIRAESSDWPGRLPKLVSGGTDALAGDKLWFGGPNAPKPNRGGGKLMIALSHDNPDLAVLMKLCAQGTVIPELNYDESADLARPPLELGDRPKEFPAFWQYKLENAVVSDCPTLKGAIDTAIVITFKNIQWLNYDPDRPMANKIVVQPEDIPQVKPANSPAGETSNSYLVTWFAPATTTTDEECPSLNHKATEADVYRYMTPEEVAALKAKNGTKGLTFGTDTERRGPHKISVAVFPGVIPDPGLFEPKTNVANGIDLDGNDGSGSPPTGIRKHGNYVSPDGRKGIDNQLFRINGCVPGNRGKRGYSNQTPNARRADGNVINLIEVTGPGDGKRDGDVNVAFIYARDKPIRDNAGKTFISNYTFRPTDDPNFSLYNFRLHGTMKDGVVTTDRVPLLKINPGQGPLIKIHNAVLRLEPQADGTMKGWLGGYLEWKRIAISSGYSEGLFDFQTPALYYAFKRFADGLKNPVSGEYEGISTAYEIDTVPAFLTSSDKPSGK